MGYSEVTKVKQDKEKECSQRGLNSRLGVIEKKDIGKKGKERGDHNITSIVSLKH